MSDDIRKLLESFDRTETEVELDEAEVEVEESALRKAVREDEQMEEAIDEFRDIQAGLFELIDRLEMAIQTYAPDKLRYWQAYGLAHLKIMAGSDEYASGDESIQSLIDSIGEDPHHDAFGESEKEQKPRPAYQTNPQAAGARKRPAVTKRIRS